MDLTYPQLIRIRDPVYGYINIYSDEERIIKNKLVSRLNRIRQLHSAWAIYPSALNTRYSHSLGVMHLIQRFAENILFRSRDKIKDYLHDEHQFEGYLRILRFWGLIHDIGHGPFSHAFEFFILKPKNLTHENIVPEFYEKTNKEFQEIINEFCTSVQPNYTDITPDLLLDFFREESKVKLLDKEDHILLYELLKLMRNGAYSIDSIDYILRDSHFCGTKEYGMIDWKRLMNLSWIIKSKVKKGKLNLTLEEKAMQCLINYYWSKYLMYDAVYFHNRCSAIEKVLKEIFIYLRENNFFDKYLNNYSLYSELDDYLIFDVLRNPPNELDNNECSQLYQKLLKIYNFNIPFKFIGKHHEARIGKFLSDCGPPKKENEENRFHDKFRKKVKDAFDQFVEDLEKNGKSYIAKQLNKSLLNDIFFHTIHISASVTLYPFAFKDKYLILLDNLFNEQIIQKKEFEKRTPADKNETKIFIPLDLFKSLNNEDCREFLKKIIKVYGELDKEKF